MNDADPLLGQGRRLTDEEVLARIAALSDADVADLAGLAHHRDSLAYYRPLATRQALAREVQRLRAELAALRRVPVQATLFDGREQDGEA